MIDATLNSEKQKKKKKEKNYIYSSGNNSIAMQNWRYQFSVTTLKLWIFPPVFLKILERYEVMSVFLFTLYCKLFPRDQ